jgi:hypothetical protein
MQEMHPVMLMYEGDPDSGVSIPCYSHFGGHVLEENSGLDYYGHETCDAVPNYSLMHRLDEILMAAINCDLKLERFIELDTDISNFCSDLEHGPVQPPPGFVLVMNTQ